MNAARWKTKNRGKLTDPSPCGSFLIDRVGKVGHREVVNDLPSGHDVDEMQRVIGALQFTEELGEVCPAGWQKR